MAFKTAGAPAKLRLRPDRTTLRANRNDLSYVIVEVLDEHDHLVPDAVVPVAFKVTGSGELAGVGSANPREMASFRQPRRNTFQGKCLAVLRPVRVAGGISLVAEAPGITPASLTIQLTSK